MALPKKRKTDIEIKVKDPYDGPLNWREQFLEQNRKIVIAINISGKIFFWWFNRIV